MKIANSVIDEQKALAVRKLHEQIIAKNIPKQTPDREKVISDTLSFIQRTFEGEALRPEDVKKLTILRVENDNQDLEMIPCIKVPTPEQLADALDQFPLFNNRLALKTGQQLPLAEPACDID